jgi:penicillin-binding protein 1A
MAENKKNNKPDNKKNTVKKETQKNKEKTNSKSKSTQIGKENNKQLKKVKKVKFKDKHPKLSIALKIILVLIIVLIVIASGIVIGVIYGAFGDEFEISQEDLIYPMMNSFVVDQDGNVLAELSGDDGKMTMITLDKMSPYLVNAYLSMEDERFYDHDGVDLYRTAGAVFTYITHAGNSSFGGSTITQQLVKNFTHDDEKNGIEGIKRKVKEWVKAYKIEKMLTKNQILELYLNLIFVGGQGNYGVEVGANYYFNKKASDLTLLECAFLAGINSNPNLYNPYGEKGYGVNENKTNKINNKVKVVLAKMLELGKIKQEEYDVATKELAEQGMKFTKGIATNNYSYHTDALINQVITDLAEAKGISRAEAQRTLYTKGLTIYSTQNASIQQKTEEAVNNAVKLTAKYNENGQQWTEDSQAAMVVLDHKTGYVVGCSGGVGTKEARGLNRATQSLRQPGSTIKPIIAVAPGIEEKVITAGTIYNDAFTIFDGNYKPKNYNYYRGNITVRQAVETSQNIPFVKIVADLGVDKAIQYLEKMGVSTLDKERDGLSLSIGGATHGISPLEMAAAYATIANDGVYIEPTFYTKVVDQNGNTILTPTQQTNRVFSETTASIVKNILTEPVKGANGTAKNCAISGIDVAAKTGTTNGDKDRWLCGFTNYYTSAVWYGFDTPSQIIVKGISPATRIWAAGMKNIHTGLAKSTFSLTGNVVTANICRDSGKLASDTCYNTYSEIFEKGTIPESCEGHTGYTICNETQLLANPYCTSTSMIYKTYLVDKEKTGKWQTDANQQETYIPTEYCTVHQHIEVPVQEPDSEPEESNRPTNPPKPDEGNTTNPDNPTEKPSTDPDKKPEEKPSEGGDKDDENKPGEGGADNENDKDKEDKEEGSKDNTSTP